MKVSIIVLLTIMLTSSMNHRPVAACKCRLAPVCAEFSGANKVFIGKAEKIEKMEENSLPIIAVQFAVKKTFKGTTQESEILKYYSTDCLIEFKAGTEYLVYDRPYNGINSFCSRTETLDRSASDLKYIESLSSTDPIFTVQGYVDGLSKEKVQNSLLEISNGRQKERSTLDQGGYFSITTKMRGKITASISLPFKAEAREGTNERVSFAGTVTRLEYDVDFVPNSCDSREIFFTRPRK